MLSPSSPSSFLSYLTKADSMKRWWPTEYAHGTQYRVIEAAVGNARYAEVYFAWRFVLLTITTFTLVYGWVRCSHYAHQFYFTTWQVEAGWLYSLCAFVSVVLVRFVWKLDTKDVVNEELVYFTRWRNAYVPVLSSLSPYWFIKFTWFTHGLAFCYTAWVFILYWAGSAGEMSLDVVSVFSHAVMTSVLTLDFFLSNIAWPISLVAYAPAYGLAYMLWSVVHHRAKLGHFVSDKGKSCAEQYADSLNQTFLDADLIFIYRQLDWNEPNTAVAVSTAVIFIIPLFVVVVWFFRNLVAWSESAYCVRCFKPKSDKR